MLTQNQKMELYKATGSKYFPKNYKNDVFMLWFEGGKPDATGLKEMIQPVIGTTIVPDIRELHKWISEDFKLRAMDLDRQISVAMTEQVVIGKVEMLKRHIKVAKTMQDTAIEYLEEHKDDLGPATAVRLLVEGIRIERESAGIPEALEKMTQMSDDELIKQIDDIIKKSPARIEMMDE